MADHCFSYDVWFKMVQCIFNQGNEGEIARDKICCKWLTNQILLKETIKAYPSKVAKYNAQTPFPSQNYVQT